MVEILIVFAVVVIVVNVATTVSPSFRRWLYRKDV